MTATHAVKWHWPAIHLCGGNTEKVGISACMGQHMVELLHTVAQPVVKVVPQLVANRVSRRGFLMVRYICRAG